MEKSIVKNPLSEKPVISLLLKFAMPSIFILIINSLYNIIDQFFIGNSVGYLGNGATNIIMPLSTMAGALSAMIGDGVSAFFNLYLGKGQKERVSQGAMISLVCAVITSSVFAVIALLFLEQLCRVFGASDVLLPYCTNYGKYIVMGYPFIITASVLSSLIRSDGHPQYSMMTIVAGAIINCMLDPLLIFTFDLGIAGAGLATMISQIVSFFLTLSYVKKFQYCSLSFRNLKMDIRLLTEILSLGLSSFISQIAVTVVLVLCNNLFAIYGALSPYGDVIPLTVFGIVTKINSLIYSIAIGFASGSQPVISFNYGANLMDRVKKVFQLSVLFSTMVMLFATILYQCFPEYLIKLFGDGDALYIEFAVKCFRIHLLFAATHGFVQCTSVMFQAIGKVKHAIFISLSRQIIFFLPFVVILPYFFGVEGILLAGASADILSFICCLGLCLILFRKLD